MNEWVQNNEEKMIYIVKIAYKKLEHSCKEEFSELLKTL